MNKLLAVLMSAAFALTAGSAFAQADKKDAMAKDGMKKDEMKIGGLCTAKT